MEIPQIYHGIDARSNRGDSESSLEVTYSLSEAAEMIKSYPQYVLSLINREDMKFLGISKYSESGSRETYQFTKHQIYQLRKIIDLIDSGRPAREAAYMIKQEDENQKLARQLSTMLLSWMTDPSEESWKSLVEAVSESPFITDLESRALKIVEGSDESFAQCAEELNIRESELRSILRNAKAKIGLNLLDLLQMTSEKK